MLIRHEGYRFLAYLCPADHWSIGVGHNLDAKPLKGDMHTFYALYGYITESMLERLFNEDVEEAINGCRALYPAFDDFRIRRQNALTDFLFNVGVGTARTFKTTNRAINEGRWQDAANGLRNSKYYKQVKGRGETIARMIEEG
jgi:GH24 family phage-related lysozyme (muramidase)